MRYQAPTAELHLGMEPLPGFEDINAVTERQYPGVREIFDRFYNLLKAPGDIREEIRDDRAEFPIEAAIAVPDENGVLKVLSRAENSTNRHKNSHAHAEMLAMEYAFEAVDDKHLPAGAVLLSTVEPCGMCTNALHRSGGSHIVFSASQDDLRGTFVYVNGVYKPFGVEPEGYSAKEELLARNSSAVVIGGYRRMEALQLI